MLACLLCRVKGAVTSSTSFGGFPTNMDYVLSAKDEDVIDSNFMHERCVTSIKHACIAS